MSYYIFLGLLVGGIATLIGCFVGSSMKAARPDTSGLILSIIVGVIFWYLSPLVSGQKPNRFNWLESIEVSLLGWSDDNAVCNGIFSKIVTERTCINV